MLQTGTAYGEAQDRAPGSSEVLDALGALHKAQVALADVLDSLAVRLTPALRPSEPRDVAHERAELKAVAPLSPLVLEIRGAGHRMLDFRDRVTDLLERLEL